MSWTMGTVRAAKGDLEELEAAGYPQTGYGEAESKAALEQAKKIIVSVIDSGALGDGPFIVSAHGHSNPGGVPEGGWASDMLSITIGSQASAPPAA